MREEHLSFNDCTYLIIKLGKMAVVYKYRMHYWIAVHSEHNTVFTALFEHKLLVNIRKSTYQRGIARHCVNFHLL